MLPALLSLLVLLAGCSADGGAGGDGDTGPAANGEPQTTSVPQETTGASNPETMASTTGDEVVIEQISSGARGTQERQIVLAPSPEALSAATGVQVPDVPDAGESVYVAAFWGEQPTGGYSVDFISAARGENGRVVVRLETNRPPPDAIVTQALTYPYAVAVVRNVDLQSSELSFVREDDRELRWPVRQV